MTITPTRSEWQELWAETAKNSQQNSLKPFESYCQVPRQFGKGYVRNVEVYLQLWFAIEDYEYYAPSAGAAFLLAYEVVLVCRRFQ